MRLSNTFVRRAAAVAFTVGVIAAATTGPAHAAAPTNDSYADRVVVDTPFSAVVDTSEATTDAADADLNAACGAPATDASIWYEVTASSNGGMVIDVGQSSYTAGAIVATGGPGAWTVVGCAPSGFSWASTAGTTYTILVFDDQYDGGGNGGTATVFVDLIPPPPTMDLTVNPRGQFTKAGEAIISGTMTCAPSGLVVDLETVLTQRFGRVILRGFNSLQLVCDGTEQPWSTGIVAYTGKFAGGKAASVTFAYACGHFECGFDYEERIVQLSRAS